MNIFRLHRFCIRAFFAFVTIFLTVFTVSAQAQYIYVEPTQYLQVDSNWGGISRPASAEIGCQSIAEGYTKAAGPPYIGRVQKLTHPSPTYWGCYLDRSSGDGIWYHDADPDGAIRQQNECQPGFVFDTSIINSDGSTHLRCRGLASYQIVGLSGPSEVRPAGTGGNTTVDLTAKVAQGGNPKAGVVVSFSVDVIANSGGHEHNDSNRPKGTLIGTQGTTDANGEVQVTFKAPEIAGIHTIKATCATCSNNPVTKEVQVRVPDLLPISPNPPRNVDGTFVYALTSVDKIHQGNGRYHHNQYYLTEQSQINLQSMIAAFAAEGWGTVALNDASLYWGGRYDITSNWGAPHAAHREGREIDISFTRAQNPVSVAKQKIFYKKFCESKTVQVPFSILHHYVLVPHFHVFLEKQTACFKSEH